MGKLTIFRNAGESVMIGDDIKVTCKPREKKGDFVLDIEAPPHVVIKREEIYQPRRDAQ